MNTITLIAIYYWFSTFYCAGRKVDVGDGDITPSEIVIILLTSWFIFPFVLGLKYK